MPLNLLNQKTCGYLLLVDYQREGIHLRKKNLIYKQLFPWVHKIAIIASILIKWIFPRPLLIKKSLSIHFMPVFSIIDCKILRSHYCTYQESAKEKSIRSLNNFPVTFIRMLCICQKKNQRKTNLILIKFNLVCYYWRFLIKELEINICKFQHNTSNI